jgi:hypothetical protein
MPRVRSFKFARYTFNHGKLVSNLVLCVVRFRVKIACDNINIVFKDEVKYRQQMKRISELQIFICFSLIKKQNPCLYNV